jgi:lipopolysaccharide transport system permease protein
MSFAPDATPAGAIPLDEWVVEPRQHGIAERIRELWQYRRLWWYFAANTVTEMLRKSTLGWFWMLMRVAGPIGISAIIFGGVLEVSSGANPPIPYFLFFLCGMTTWMLFERSLIIITRSVEQNRRLITKIYFPRLILPMSAVAIAFVYLTLLLIVMIGTSVYFFQRDAVWYIRLRPELLVSVAAVAVSLVFAISVGLWTSVLQARYRDVRYALRYFMPFWMYFTPIIYPLTRIPEEWRWLAIVNPMTGVVEAFKWGTLGNGHLTAQSVAISLTLVTLTMISGIWFFTREEAASVDKL